MYSELYTAVSGMVVRQRQLDLLANNLANINTVGFKVEDIQLEERPIPSSQGLVRAPSHVGQGSRWIDYSPGAIQTSGQPLDFALEGEGFFVVQTRDGTRLTRDGRFSQDEQGQLVLRGMPVQGVNGAIQLGEGPIECKEDGTIMQGGAPAGRLRVVKVPTPQQLEREEGGVFRVPDGVPLEDAPGARIRQGCVEMSNANAIRLMVQMIDAVRCFELHQRMIHTFDQLGQKAVQILGRTA
jgi:flagellar basal-body rod protein FlgG